jgi:hypothetical protein
MCVNWADNKSDVFSHVMLKYIIDSIALNIN